MNLLARFSCLILMLALASLSFAQDPDDDDLPTVAPPKNGYQCLDWQGIRRERTTPCAENGESEFRGYDNIHDAKRDIKKLVDGNGKLKNPANPNSADGSSANAGRTSPAADELSPEEKKRRRYAWMKFIAVACVFGFIAKMRKASFIRWAIVGVFVYGTLVLGNFVTL